MPLVSKTIPNLVNGVSQQPDSLRLPTQAELQENLFSSVVEGLSDRPPTEHIAKLFNGTLGDAFAHVINRSVSERYMVLIKNGSLTVHTLAGVQKTVSTPNGTSYLTTTTPSTSIKAITVQDYTFIVNTEILAALDAAVTATRPKEALIFVKAGNYGSDYKVFIDGVQKAIKTTSTTSVTDIATNFIAADLAADLVASLGAGWTVTSYNSVISVVKASGDFKITSEDSQGGASLQVFKDSVQSFSSLPTVAPTDFQIKVNGQPESETDDYYVKFVPATTGTTFGEGSWEETRKQGTQYHIDPTTMPWVLVREADGSFTFRVETWDDLTVGDIASTSPQPSFIGHTINDVFFFKNRLSLLSSDKIICSEAGQYFNFWPTTVTTVLDSDRIDYTVSHTKVAVLRHAVPFDEKVILFSDQTQFVLQGGTTLTQKTITVDPTTEFENSLYARPVAAGNNVYFATPNGNFHGIREYFVDETTATKDAVDVTAHVPKYIPNGAFRLMASSTVDTLVALSSGNKPSMYVYKYFWGKDKEKLQSAWSRMFVGGASTIIVGGDFIESVLYLAIQRQNGVFLEKINFSPGLTDPNVNYVTHYDRRITEAQCTSVVYNAGANQTTWTLPYEVDGTPKVVTRLTNCGVVIPVTNPTSTTLVATGNYSATTVYIGQTYMRTYTLSKFFYRDDAKNGGAIVAEGRLQVRTCTLVFSDTGLFNVTVSQDYRDPNSYVQYRDPQDSSFTGRVLGAGSNLIGAVALASGEMTFPVWAQNDKVTITITSDSFLPMHLQSAAWEGFYHARARRV
ncbi:MAG: hypothetical protein A4E20_01445 [Nitrospira sp. SG-bin2]|uniref:phage nozzle protein n=1 Tax=Nitrospira cf. moscoviensis SBR1015 TaxID=96242 RepID=UPI000A0E078E|nr:hypothetical protein [Nitrospira cf. moscoviensis SBR1015]OQW34869.1 MAG: hypothetical protein A4E20_01445 [Nitrospira sp. SG-bin2]